MEVLEGFGVLLVDDHPLFRDGLAAALQHRVPALRVCTVGTLDEALRELSASEDGFDLVLLDYHLPGTDGLRCAAHLRQLHPQVGIGLITGLDDPALPRRARDAGLLACLAKTLEAPALLACLRRLAAGETVFDAHLPGPRQAGEDAAFASFGLTDRQLQVLRELATGASNKEIARALAISPATVKNHLEAIFARMDVAGRVQAVLAARAALHGAR
ncbi:response regulator transcription factor [Pulveribacter suum]|uniref:response regulator transcription factor n=1 Tax=Pulveribacter suum TaxID=2116657 RepID=UPI001D040A12|nr:response regulator transcription factor [Pulveribacter suum]